MKPSIQRRVHKVPRIAAAIAGARPGAPSVEVLESVMRFTTERKREALVRALVRTMREVLPATRIEFHPCDPTGDDASPPSPDARGGQRARDLALCLERLRMDNAPASLQPSILTSEYSLHPLCDTFGVSGVVAIDHLPGKAVDPGIVHALLRIYGNFVAIIDDSHRDTLTGLLNRKTFEESVQAVLRESRASAWPSRVEGDQRRPSSAGACHWLAIIDIDHFKRINDTFGHLYGDEVLLLLAQLMLRSFRRSDRIYRFGGEEFAVLLSPCGPEDAHAVLDRFRVATQDHGFPQVGQVTISIGFVAIRQQDIPATVVGHADEALYASKHGGRNRVTSYESLETKATAARSFDADLF